MVRIGVVPYLNAKPLIRGLDKDRAIALSFAPPSELARRLKLKRVDIAMLPTAEILRSPSYRILSDVAIACDGDAGSVRLYFRTNPIHLKRVALDDNSRTSNALAKIIVEKKFGVKPRYCRHDPAKRSTDGRWDAAVVIGDNAFRGMDLPYLDLGGEWKELTGLPFVFALWTAWRGFNDNGISTRLEAARDEGVKRIPRIAGNESNNVGQTTEFCREYLSERMKYRLGNEERKGLECFRRHMRRMNLI